MKIAFCIRANYETHKGGDTTQCINTKTNLESLFDVTVDIVTNPDRLDESYDVIHIFNLATRHETMAFFEKASMLTRPNIALSPIFWNYDYAAIKDVAAWFNFNIPQRQWHTSAALLANRVTSRLFNKPRIIAAPFRDFCAYCINHSDILLPNSTEELEELGKFAGFKPGGLTDKSSVAVNATEFPEYDIENGANEYKVPPGFILQVGRIEFAKNQLNVVRALYNLPEIPIVFIGRPNDKAYAEKLRKIAGKRGNVFFFNEVPHEKIYSFYKKAALHILPSFRESPGLVSLEALSQKCKIVVADKRFTPADTYFKDVCTIINPSCVRSIRDGILTELKTQRDMDTISNLVRHKFTWPNTARQTYEAYKKVLG